jgi:hypothetical protein
MIPSVAVVAVLFFGLASLPSRVAAPGSTLSCKQTPAENLLPEVIGPMAGSRPAWFVDGGDLSWDHAEHPVKTLWVVSRTSSPVRITGHRLDAPGTARFRLGQDNAIQTELLIADPSVASAIPGGATPEVMQAYSFIPSHVFYSSPGCWEFTVQWASEEVRLVLEIKRKR